jgi:hypothetical protein
MLARLKGHQRRFKILPQIGDLFQPIVGHFLNCHHDSYRQLKHNADAPEIRPAKSLLSLEGSNGPEYCLWMRTSVY